jgi:hypothetical protein
MKEAAEARAAAHEKGTRDLRTTGDVVAGSALLVGAVFPPALVAMGITAATVKLVTVIAGAVRDGEDKTLRGDKAVVATYIKNSAGWSREKRVKEANKLLKAYKEHKEKGEKRYLLTDKKYKDRDSWIIKNKQLRWKLLALHVNEVNAKAFPNKPLVKGKANTTPSLADRLPSDASSLDDAQTAAMDAGVTAAPDTLAPETTAIPWTPILAAAGVAGVLLIVATRPKPAAPAYPPDERGGKGGARA